MFDYDDTVPFVDQPVQAVQQPVDVREMQAGRRFIEDIEDFVHEGTFAGIRDWIPVAGTYRIRPLDIRGAKMQEKR